VNFGLKYARGSFPSKLFAVPRVLPVLDSSGRTHPQLCKKSHQLAQKGVNFEREIIETVNSIMILISE
jgi:hypothetical protein